MKRCLPASHKLRRGKPAGEGEVGAPGPPGVALSEAWADRGLPGREGWAVGLIGGLATGDRRHAWIRGLIRRRNDGSLRP